MNIAVYSKYGNFYQEFVQACDKADVELTLFIARSYNLFNYVFETSDLLVIQHESYTKDVQLLIKYAHQRNIPVLFFSNSKWLVPKYFDKLQKKSDIDTIRYIKECIKTANACNGIIMSDAKLFKVLNKTYENVIYINPENNDIAGLSEYLNRFYEKHGCPLKSALRTNISDKFKANNRKYRKNIFPHLMPDKASMTAALIGYGPQYEKYILKLTYNEIKNAYKDLVDNKRPKIFTKYTKKLLIEQQSDKIYKMILDVSKELDCPLDEIAFYILKDIDSSSPIFKNKNVLSSFIKDFCELSYCTNVDNELIFKIKDCTDKKLIKEIPDTYNIRNFLTSAYESEDNYKVLYKLLDLCKNKIIIKQELYYISYLLKKNLISPQILTYMIQNDYINDGRIDYTKIPSKFLKQSNTKNSRMLRFLEIQKSIKYEPHHFFINIPGYGKDLNWGKKMAMVTDKATAMILSDESYDKVLGEICFYIKQNALENPRTDKLNLECAGALRCMQPNRNNSVSKTRYDIRSKYGITYAEKFSKFKDPNKALKSPYKDLKLTRISVSKKDVNSGLMHHVSSNDTIYCFKYVERIYAKLIKYIDTDKKGVENKIISLLGRLHWILAHNVPWARGSDSIANVFLKSIIKSLGIEVGCVKSGLSFDLEAFCTEVETYEKNYSKYYESFVFKDI